MREHIGAVESPSPPALLLRASALRLQRKCACGGGAPGMADQCEECGRHAAATRSKAHPAAETTPTREPAHVPGFVVDDGTVDLKPGQMRKSDFLAQLREEVCRAAEEALAGTGRNTAGCPYLGYWFQHYAGQAASHIEKALLRYAPGAGAASSAQEYIAIAAERARLAVMKWVRSGEIDAPKDAVTAAPAARVQFKADIGGARQPDSPAAVRQQLGAGAPLPADVLGRMELAFEHDFSRVRVHADAGAHTLAMGLNAHAFTIGGDVAFAAGTYRPGTPAGDALIAHELAHVVQQAGAGPENGPAQVSGAEYRALEDDADRAAAGAVASLWSGAKTIARGAMPCIRSGLSLQRCSKKDSEPPKDARPGPVRDASPGPPRCDRSKDKSPMGPIPQQPVGECQLPVRKSLGDVELVGGKPGILGVTDRKTIGYKPAVSLPDASGNCTAKLESRPKLEFDPYMSVKAGTYKLNKGEVDSPGSRCHGKTVTPWEVVDPATADKAAAGEREHCRDMQLAYAKTFARVEKFYDDLAGGFCADDPTASDPSSQEICEKEVEKRFEKRMGFPQEQFAKRAHCLFRATNKRDENGWHCAIAHPTRFSPDCSAGWWTFDPATTLTEVDDGTNKDKKRSHPPEEIVVHDTGAECSASGGGSPCKPKIPSGGAT